MLNGGDGLSNIFETAQQIMTGLTKAPAIAKDVSQFAKLAKTIQTPAFQQEIKEAKSGIETYAKAQLGLQAISALAIFGMFLITVMDHRRKS